MANTDKPNGFKPVKHLNGSPYNGQCRKYYIASDYATALGVGDIVKLTGESSAKGVPEIEAISDATDTPVGVIVGFVPTYADLNTRGSAANTEGYAMVCDSPDIILEAQADADLVAADVGANVSPTTTTASTTTGMSTMEISSSTVDPSGTSLIFQILEIVQREDNEIGQNYCRALVRFNEHSYLSSTGANGV